MKILFLSEAPLIKYGLLCGFSQLGHEVDFMYGDYRLWDKDAETQFVLLNRKIRSFLPDAIFTEGYHNCPIVEFTRLFKKFNIKTFFWGIEDPVTTSISKYYAPHFDYCFTTTKECIPMYNQIGKQAEVLLFACNPEYHKPAPCKPQYKTDMMMVGSNYSSRYKETEWFLMSLIKKNKYNIQVYGHDWWMNQSLPVHLAKFPKIYKGILPYEELSSAYSSTKVILGMNCDGSSITQTSMRPYESISISNSALYMGHYTKAQEAIFGDLIYLPKNKDETLEMVELIMKMSESDRINKALKAQEFVRENHNYRQRAQQVINVFNQL
jgi:spore maturation protein CgeB